MAIVVGIGLLSYSGFYAIGFILAGSDKSEFEVTAPQFNDVVNITGASVDHPAPSLASLYPLNVTLPKYWSKHQESEDAPLAPIGIPDGFTLLTEKDSLNSSLISESEVTRIQIPAIYLDSSVSALKLLDIGNSQQYETPDNTVGFIPETSLPGQEGAGWYFGHLESYGHNEGSVFRNLPKVSELIKHDPVDIILTTEEAEYIYRVEQTLQMSAKELSLKQNANDNSITLVTCWPPKIYTERVLVSASMIAVKYHNNIGLSATQ